MPDAYAIALECIGALLFLAIPTALVLKNLPKTLIAFRLIFILAIVAFLASAASIVAACFSGLSFGDATMGVASAWALTLYGAFVVYGIWRFFKFSSLNLLGSR